jgi:hypothetical protein
MLNAIIAYCFKIYTEMTEYNLQKKHLKEKILSNIITWGLLSSILLESVHKKKSNRRHMPPFGHKQKDALNL